MGIRFQCPQGHIINVKDFLAGKKGVCPDCGAKVLIPLESTHRKDGTPIVKSEAAAVPASIPESPAQAPAIPSPMPVAATPTGLPSPAPIMPTVNTPVVTVAAGATAIPAGIPVGAVAPAAPVAVAAMPLGAGVTAVKPAAVAVPVGGAPVAAPFAAPVAVAVGAGMPGAVPVAAAYPVGGAPAMGMPTAMPPRPPLTPGGPMPPGLIDPISEAPHAAWYIRPAAGGQFGPARGDVMRQWLAEGRLAADSLVWRDGWPDWKNAALVFPQLTETPAAAPMEFVKSEPAAQSAAKYQARRQSGNSMGIAMIVILGLVCVGLGIALVVLLPKMK